MCPPRLPWGHIGTIWWIWLSLCFLRSTRVHNPNGKSIIQPFLHSLWQKVPILCNGRPFPLKLPLPMGIWHHPTRFLGPIRAYNQMASRSVQPFLHRWPQSVPILYNGTPLSLLKIAPSHWGIQTPSNTWFPGPTQVLNTNGISIGSAGSLVWQTGRLTDHATQSVTIWCIYVRSTAMRSKNSRSTSQKHETFVLNLPEVLVVFTNWNTQL